MKQLLWMMLSMLSALLFLCLGGCAGEEAVQSRPGLDPAVQPEYVTEWPENSMTEKIPPPKQGEISYVRDYSGSGRYEIVWQDITREESEAYLQQLAEAGYTPLLSDENESSAGILLQKGEVTLSISYSGTVLVILISTGAAG